MQIDNKRVANLRCSEYFTPRHISQKCQLNTFEIIMNFFVNINIILKEIKRYSNEFMTKFEVCITSPEIF